MRWRQRRKEFNEWEWIELFVFCGRGASPPITHSISQINLSFSFILSFNQLLWLKEWRKRKKWTEIKERRQSISPLSFNNQAKLMKERMKNLPRSGTAWFAACWLISAPFKFKINFINFFLNCRPINCATFSSFILHKEKSFIPFL